MTVGDALPMVAFIFSIPVGLIGILYVGFKADNEELRIRADLLKAGIDPDRLDKEGEDE